MPIIASSMVLMHLRDKHTSQNRISCPIGKAKWSDS